MKTFLNDYDPNSDCSCVLEVEHEYIKNGEQVWIIGHYELKNVIRYPDKRCRVHKND